MELWGGGVAFSSFEVLIYLFYSFKNGHTKGITNQLALRRTFTCWASCTKSKSAQADRLRRIRFGASWTVFTSWTCWRRRKSWTFNSVNGQCSGDFKMSIFVTLLLDSSLPARPEINENNNDESIGKKIKYWFRIVDSINFTTTTTSTYRWCTFYSFRNKPLLHCILSM